jgi:hypothetical protein
LILKEFAVWGDEAAPFEPGGAPVWLARVDLATLVRASGLRGWGNRWSGLGCGNGVRSFATLPDKVEAGRMTDWGRG